MSATVFEVDAEIALGTPVVIESGKVVPYDDMEHVIGDIIGVVYPTPITNSGRNFSVVDGASFYTNDYNNWSELLEREESVNESYTPFNPFTETNSYTIVVSRGLVPVLKSFTTTIPTQWKLVKENVTDADWYFIP